MLGSRDPFLFSLLAGFRFVAGETCVFLWLVHVS